MNFTRVPRGFCALLLMGLATTPVAAQTAADQATSQATPSELERAPQDLRAGLERLMAGWTEAERSAVLAFYAARDFAPFWSGPGSDRGAALAAALRNAPAQGLPAARYAPGDLAAALAVAASDPAGAALAEVTATRAYLDFGADLGAGVLEPSAVDPEIDVRPRRPEPAALLARLGAGPVDATLAGLEPRGPEYRALIAEKARLETLAAATDEGPPVPSGPTLRLGDAGPRVAALRARLAARGHPAAAADPATFDEGLAAALTAFQSAAALDADGLAGARTVAALNAGPREQLAQVVVNLERMRWMNGRIEGRHIYVNIPDYSVRLVEDGRPVFVARAVVGKATDTRTPEFSDRMTYIVVNPTWHIPDSIAQRVYLPRLQADPATLADSNMRIFTRGGTEINPGLVDFKQFASGNFPFRIKQNPSGANALGEVKFMFPNQHAIYLHDTPTRELFNRTERAFSNGCIRVQNPMELARLLLDGQLGDPAATLDGWIRGGGERTITLDRPIPVHLVYRTVFLDDAGRLQRRFDVYGRDAKVFEALVAKGVTLPAAQG